MAGTLYAGFDLARVGSMSCVVTDDVVTGITATVSATKYAHVDLSSVMGTGLYTAFAAAVQTALRAASPTVNYTVSYSSATRAYTITNPHASGFLDFQQSVA